MYICYTKLFEIELFICIKMDSALTNQKSLICHKRKQTDKQATKQAELMSFVSPSSYLNWNQIDIHF